MDSDIIQLVAVSFIIPNYNGKEFIHVCIESVLRQSFKDFEVIVVDDHSTDGSAEYIKSKWHDINVIPLKRNAGFCHAVNAGIDYAHGKYIALINSDIELDSRWLEYMITAIERYRDAFSINAKILNFYDRNKMDDAGDVYTREGRAFKRGYNQPAELYTDAAEIFSASGAASLYKAKLLKQLNGLDEIFVAYLDDVDLGFRARLIGYKNYFEPQAIAYHKVNMSYKKRSILMGSLVLKNNMSVIVKDMPGSLIIKSFPWLILGHLKSVKYIYSVGGVRAILKGYYTFLKTVPYLFKERIKIQKIRSISTDDLNKIMLKFYNQRTAEEVKYK
ncbi:MAG: glycosyltransferase family 2 protein [Deltaproteobacteria bacterium]|nr:glycosyltransferase family 2 protein [Deltaproteobacteria bacterium]MCL5878236.1 glycosyltransferase family 2 protein [Deltaproteobacteria bacterium]